MRETLSNRLHDCQRYFLVFAALLLVQLTSCPIKSSIKTLIGIPIHTEQQTAKGNLIFQGSGLEKCGNGKTVDTQVFRIRFSTVNNLLPVALLTADFLRSFGDPRFKEQPHPFYGNLRISGTLPIFLQYRKLII
ncbi:hypothetical protein [Parapedobacter indicus]|uniref:Uncharacterized protein n=1 Tax=Parapedobacter indicus TaxID=1477437 RepID=A0A1I3CPQ3_9SPHI|nr:hypothetical protein [Parapedobacter indicus]PPL04339.1 hypothetical protein CLV26_101140 [Parapedobacter indicus]SFH76363.1 hypothetical protein SAMN05444682_101127 [Parapedobacter indicus]